MSLNISQKYTIYKKAIEAMQGKTFYCEDEGGTLRRWTPPRPLSPATPQPHDSEGAA